MDVYFLQLQPAVQAPCGQSGDELNLTWVEERGGRELRVNAEG